MSELQHYYDVFCMGGLWRREDADECGCRGCGWFISDVDTVHKCNTHYDGQPHPEDPEIHEEELVCSVCGGTEENEDGGPCSCALPIAHAPEMVPACLYEDDDIPF